MWVKPRPFWLQSLCSALVNTSTTWLRCLLITLTGFYIVYKIRVRLNVRTLKMERKTPWWVLTCSRVPSGQSEFSLAPSWAERRCWKKKSSLCLPGDPVSQGEAPWYPPGCPRCCSRCPWQFKVPSVPLALISDNWKTQKGIHVCKTAEDRRLFLPAHLPKLKSQMMESVYLCSCFRENCVWKVFLCDVPPSTGWCFYPHPRLADVSERRVCYRVSDLTPMYT